MNMKFSILLLPIVLGTVSLSQGCKTVTELAITQKGSVTIEWSSPTQNDDGSALTDLSGYKIRYGTAPGIYTSFVDVGNVNTYTVRNLEVGKTYYFSVSALNSTADESPGSNEEAKRTEAAAQ